MASVVRLLLCSLTGLTLPWPTLSCQSSDKPLLLSPYLDKYQVDKARSLSKVDKSCLDDFVPESYTGFLTVDKQLGNHLFFWFFPSSENEKAPLLLWLNGGPTISSMLGLFWEHGPMSVSRKHPTNSHCNEKKEESESGYTKRKYSWTGPFSMLYVDNPAGVGFSFSDSGDKGHRFTEDGYTKDMVSFMKQFFRLFSEYRTRDVYLGGQSYAGKYISALAYEIHQEIQEGRSNFNLTGIYLGAPWFDPEIQNDAFVDFFYAMGAMTHKAMLDAKEANTKFYNKVKAGNVTINEAIAFRSDSFRRVTIEGSFDNYVTGRYPGYSEINNLLARPEMRNAAHAGDMQFAGTHINYSLNMYQKFAYDDMVVSTKSRMAELMNNYKVLIYNGDYDAAVGTTMVEEALLTMSWKFQEEYNSTHNSVWKRNDKLIGYYSLTDKFCRVVIHGSGHQVPHEQTEVAFHMMTQFINKGCVEDFHTPDPMTASFSRLAVPSHLRHFVLGGLIFTVIVTHFGF